MGDNIKNGLDGLSKIDEVAEIIHIAIYWVAILFIIVFVAYIFAYVNCYLNRKRKGSYNKDSDDFLDD